MLNYENTRPAFQKSKRLKLCAVAWLTVCSHHVVPGAVSASPPRRHIDLPFRQLTVTSASVICTLNRSPLEMVGVRNYIPTIGDFYFETLLSHL